MQVFLVATLSRLHCHYCVMGDFLSTWQTGANLFTNFQISTLVLLAQNVPMISHSLSG